MLLTHKQVISTCLFKVGDRLHHCNIAFTENCDHGIDNLWRKVLHVYILLNLELFLIVSLPECNPVGTTQILWSS